MANAMAITDQIIINLFNATTLTDVAKSMDQLETDLMGEMLLSDVLTYSEIPNFGTLDSSDVEIFESPKGTLNSIVISFDTLSIPGRAIFLHECPTTCARRITTVDISALARWKTYN